MLTDSLPNARPYSRCWRSNSTVVIERLRLHGEWQIYAIVTVMRDMPVIYYKETG